MGFIINLKKYQLVETPAKILVHLWSSDGFWAPNTTKLEVLAGMPNAQLLRMNRASFYRLSNIFREYVPRFTELMDPLWGLLS